MTYRHWYLVKRHYSDEVYAIIDGVQAYNLDHAKSLARKYNWWKPGQYLTVELRLDHDGVIQADGAHKSHERDEAEMVALLDGQNKEVG